MAIEIKDAPWVSQPIVPHGAVDPITLELVKGATRAMQAEMENLIERTTMSPFIHEKKDYFVGIYARDGGNVVGNDHPNYGNVMDAVFHYYPIETMKPGDLYWYNDCYGSNGGVTHSPDMLFIVPIFVDGELVAFSQSKGHFWDIGGSRAGSMSADATEIFHEGTIVPPIKIINQGVWNDEALRIFLANTRFPDIMRNDIRAIMAAAQLGERRMLELCARFGAQTVMDAFLAMREQTARYVRRAVEALVPEGTYHFEEALDNDGVSGKPVWIRLTLTHKGGRLVLDTRESDDQTRGPANFLMHHSVPKFSLALYLLAREPSLMHNAGSIVALDEVLQREGSVLWPRWPAPLGSRGQTNVRFQMALMGMFAQASGGESPAASAAYSLYLFRGLDRATGQYFLCTDGVAVGHGARSDADGHDAIYGPGQKNYPAEYIADRFPLRIERYAINTDSGGPGQFRGGCGVIREVRLLADEAVLGSRLDNVHFPPYGVNGGMSGRNGGVTINPGQPDERVIEPTSDGTVMRQGDLLRFATSGGGGWGHPFDRPAHLVERDVRDGFVSLGSAYEDYGVVLDPATLALDARATDERRRTARQSAKLFHRKEYFD
ncbi:MAG TPA: hydantoinase B/oxoprolinase family protein [Chloroflexota bacterium]|jgi:N-methylhydantoinase B